MPGPEPDIADKIDAAIGAAPSAPPALDGTIALGRRALRRRRIGYAVGAAATVLVVGGTAWALSPGDAEPRSENHGFAGDPTESPTDKAPTWRGEDAARLDRSGQIELKAGWHVVQKVDGHREGVTGAEIAKGERRQWFLWGDGATFVSLRAPEPGYETFQDWVDVNLPIILADDGHGGGNDDRQWEGVPRDDLVEFGTGETLVARDGVTIVEQRPSPDVGDGFATEGDTSAVAVVEVDGARWYVLARDLDGPAQYIAVSDRDAGRDLEQFLDLARSRYAEGGGGLL